MTTLREALLALADRIEEANGQPIAIDPQAAAELRRLSAENAALGVHLSERMKDLFKVEAQRIALLEALKEIYDWTTHKNTAWAIKARAAIKQVEGENT
jgi:hypothetical protein